MIIKTASDKKYTFKEVLTGEVFKHCGTYYIKTWTLTDEDEQEWNAILLEDGSYACFHTDAEVVPYRNAYLTIE